MKRAVSIFLLSVLHASAGPEGYVNFIRQNQQADGVVWDMPVASNGSAPSALMLQRGGALFQLWTVEQLTAKDYLLDQKLVGAYLPVADIRITTLDPYPKIPRTRVDQPFVVDINLSGLLPVTDFPQASTSVLLERHLGNYGEGITSLEPAKVVSSVPFSNAYLSANGKTSLRFDASSLTASDPTKASGEEHFVVHALSDGSLTQSQLASGFVQVWPVASGEIKGVKTGDEFRFQAPQIELLLNDLYPRSDTYLMLFEGTQVNGAKGSVVKAYPVDRETSESTVISVSELDSKITEDGTYTLALLSDTVFGRELLCETVTFHVRRTLRINAMQVDYSDGNDP
jgi:hypothetical protein